MNNLDTVMNELKNEPETSPEATNEETSTNTSQEQENVPVAPLNENEDVSEEPVKEQDQKVDKSQFTDMEKAQYSFRKQLGKQKEKYEQMLSEQKKAFDDMQARLDKLENPDKYKEKLRDSFKTDDEYIDYIVQQRMQKMFDEQKDKNAKLQMEREEEERNQETINTNIQECFKTEEEQKDYYSTVQKAFENGLEELMDKEGMIADYIIKSPTGPKVLYELAKDPEKVKRVYGQRDAQSRFFELKMIEREILNKSLEKPMTSQNLQKAVGTPGLAKGTTKDMFDDSSDLRSFIRRR